MAEGIEQTTIIPAKPPVDVLNSDGKSISQSGANLNSIFDLAEQGKPIADAIAEVETKKEPVKAAPEPEKKEVIKPEPTGLDKKLDQAQSKKDDEKEVTRESLLAETEAKKEPEAKEPDAKKEPEAKVDPDAVPEDELKVLPYDKPKTAKRIQALLKKVDTLNETFATSKKESDAKAAKLAELEKQLTEVKTVDPKTTEEVQKQLDELAMFRRRYELDNDPEVKTKFESRKTQAEDSITQVLTRRNAGPALLKLIADTGGWTKFSDSNNPVTFNKIDGTQETITSSQAAENILAALPLGERKQVESAMLDQLAAEREKARYFSEETKKAQDYFKTRDEQLKQQSDAQKQAMTNAQKLIENFQNETIQKKEWLQEKPVPDSATAEQKAQIEDDNRYTRQLKSLLKQNVSAKDIPTMLGIVEDSVAYYAERRTSARLLAENAALKKALETEKSNQEKFRKASSTITKPGSLSQAAANVRQEKKAPVGLEAALAAIESGGGDGDE